MPTFGFSIIWGFQMLGLMMKTPLLLSSILTHAARSFPDVEKDSRSPDQPDHCTNYVGLLKRSSQLANALVALGRQAGRSGRDAGLERLPPS